ncbi:MAG: FAD-dependent oxidoreductase [Chlamydiales bacterium]|nr:FAD-dependent oxidoreductase [Chlamydiales bacterium]
MEHRQLVIIGSGPAAYTAAIYAARANLHPLVYEGFFSGPAGGQLMTTTDVENYPGFPEGITGPELMDKMRKQAERFGTTIVTEDVVKIDLQKSPFLVQGSPTTVYADAVIIATGATAKRLDIPGTRDTELWQKGVTACAVCDGAAPIFRNKDLFVIGGGDSAVEEAIFLTKFGKRVYLVHRRDELRASKIMCARALEHPKVEILWNTVLEKVEGDGIVQFVTLRNLKTEKVEKRDAGGVLFAIGHQPNTAFLDGQIALEPIHMGRFSLLAISIICTTSLFSLEKKPWIGNPWEFTFASSYVYSHFRHVQNASVQPSTPSNDHLLRFDLSFPFSEGADLQAEVEFADTPRQNFGYRSSALQGRIRWYNDIAGDFLSWTTALHIRQVAGVSLKDISCPYQANFNIGLSSSIGKEWSRGPHWSTRMWGDIDVGIGNRGSPWASFITCFEKNWKNRHRLIGFLEGYFGLGSDQHVDVDHFYGWGKFSHRSLDLGAGYQYHFDLWGDITLSYARRIYAHTFPENVNFFLISYQIPFSCL